MAVTAQAVTATGKEDSVAKQYSKAEVQRARLVVKLNDSLRRPTSEDVRRIASSPAGSTPPPGTPRLAPGR